MHSDRLLYPALKWPMKAGSSCRYSNSDADTDPDTALVLVLIVIGAARHISSAQLSMSCHVVSCYRYRMASHRIASYNGNVVSCGVV